MGIPSRCCIGFGRRSKLVPMLEPATTLTDLLMAAISLACALWHATRRPLHGPVLLFLSFALAAVFGAVWHGFFSTADASSCGQRLLWWLSMWFGGLSAAGLALTGLELMGLVAMRR